MDMVVAALPIGMHMLDPTFHGDQIDLTIGNTTFGANTISKANRYHDWCNAAAISKAAVIGQ